MHRSFRGDDSELFEVSSLQRLFWVVADHVESAEPPDPQLGAQEGVTWSDSVIRVVLTWHHRDMLLYQLYSTRRAWKVKRGNLTRWPHEKRDPDWLRYKNSRHKHKEGHHIHQHHSISSIIMARNQPAQKKPIRVAGVRWMQAECGRAFGPRRGSRGYKLSVPKRSLGSHQVLTRCSG